MILNVIMNGIGIVIALIMLSGLFMCWIMSLAVLDYILNTNLKEKLCSSVPKWSFLYRLRQFVTHNIDELDKKIIEKDIQEQLIEPQSHEDYLRETYHP